MHSKRPFWDWTILVSLAARIGRAARMEKKCRTPTLGEVRHWKKVIRLSAQTELFEDRGVAIEIGALEVVEELAAASGHRDETTA